MSMVIPSLGTRTIALRCVLLTCLLAISAKAAVQYTVTDLGTLGGATSYAYGINNSGQVVGYSERAGSYSHAFLYEGNGPMRDLGSSQGYSYARAINNYGHIVGWDANGVFVYQNGTWTSLGFLGSAWAVNDVGQIAGTATNNGAYRYSNGNMESLGVPGSVAMGINNDGWVVGHGGSRAFLWKGTGPSQDLGTLGGSASYASAINDCGQIVGWSTNAFGSMHGFLFENGRMRSLYGCFPKAINNHGQIVGDATSLESSSHAWISDGVTQTNLNNLIAPSSGWYLTFAHDINDLGQIVGQGKKNGQKHAFLLTPIPEPATLALICICGMLVLSRWQPDR